MDQPTNTIGTVHWLTATNDMRISVYLEPAMLALPGREFSLAQNRFEEAVTKDEKRSEPTSVPEETVFGTHIREAIEVVKGLRKKQT